jgi:predicted phosphoadenosine phosphosulfate sulfurtransferase
MEFEEFVPEFGNWLAGGKETACLVGIRSDESLNRFRTIASDEKVTYDKLRYSTKVAEHLYNFYPIYDWRTEDIWIANGKFRWDYNRIYDLMHMAGVSIHQQRLCQPYGDDQRKGLYLFKILEPDTWAKVVNRVEGANFGNRYVDTDKTVLGNFRVNLPPGHTFESYAHFLLNTMPPYLKEHYQKKIAKFWEYWKKEGFEQLPDTADPKLEAAKKAPSWRRICKVLLKNDYWCKGLSFSQTKREMERQVQLITKYNEIL